MPLKKIQKRAAQTIHRAFRTTAGAAVDVEASLLPGAIAARADSPEATMRIRTSPLYNDMATTALPRSAQLKEDDQSPLEPILEYISGTQARGAARPPGETPTPHIVPPWWTPPFVHINAPPL